jgi:uncharacterized membrane protein YgdD (TMEM256/DUF423 family)
MNQMLYQSLNQRWSPFALGCTECGVFFQAIHANALLSCGVRPPKAKTPQITLVVLALGKSNSKRMTLIKSSLAV